MLVAIVCYDNPDMLDTRLANREAHVAHIKSSGIVVQAGPFLDATDNMCGSLLVLDVEDISEAQQWAADDPYKAAGLFASVTIKPWNRVIG